MNMINRNTQCASFFCNCVNLNIYEYIDKQKRLKEYDSLFLPYTFVFSEKESLDLFLMGKFPHTDK